MMHELKKMVQDYCFAAARKLKMVMATVIALDGSSYRRPGVRMLIREDGQMTGAVSGGCVEKEILRQALTVFEKGIPKVMTYDGRYRLGCEGVLYILIEPFAPSEIFLKAFENSLLKRHSLSIRSLFKKEECSDTFMGSLITFPDLPPLPFSASDQLSAEMKNAPECFIQTLKPCFKLIIIGAEHDAVQLSTFAGLMGWEVNIIAPVEDPRTTDNFPGAGKVEHLLPDQISALPVDEQTAIVLMTHSYSKDLKFLIALKDSQPAYLGLLGPIKRREKLLSEFMEYVTEFNPALFEVIHGPAGLNIGAETPQEIAISIISEILSFTRQQEPMPLKDKKNRIHTFLP